MDNGSRERIGIGGGHHGDVTLNRLASGDNHVWLQGHEAVHFQ